MIVADLRLRAEMFDHDVDHLSREVAKLKEELQRKETALENALISKVESVVAANILEDHEINVTIADGVPTVTIRKPTITVNQSSLG